MRFGANGHLRRALAFAAFASLGACRPHECAPGDRPGCTAACDSGNAESCNRLAMIEMHAARPDETTVTALFEKACAGRSATGCANLGVRRLHAAGEGNLAKAVDAFQSGCDGGSAMGCQMLGQLYCAGSGVARDEARGVASFAKACVLGWTGACATPRCPAPDASSPAP